MDPIRIQLMTSGQMSLECLGYNREGISPCADVSLHVKGKEIPENSHGENDGIIMQAFLRQDALEIHYHLLFSFRAQGAEKDVTGQIAVGMEDDPGMIHLDPGQG